MEYFKTYIIGGLICVIGQILIDKTKLTPARILVCFVVAGVILGGIGVYEPIIKFAGAGATVPLMGFGYTMAKGTMEAVQEKGLMGVLIGGVKAASAGIAAAVLFGYAAALVSKSSDKS